MGGQKPRCLRNRKCITTKETVQGRQGNKHVILLVQKQSPSYPARHILDYFLIFILAVWVFAAAQASPQLLGAGPTLQLQDSGFSLAWLLFLQGMASCVHLNTADPGSGAEAQQLWQTGFVAPWHVGSSWTRDRTHVTRTGRRVLYSESPGQPHSDTF